VDGFRLGLAGRDRLGPVGPDWRDRIGGGWEGQARQAGRVWVRFG